MLYSFEILKELGNYYSVDVDTLNLLHYILYLLSLFYILMYGNNMVYMQIADAIPRNPTYKISIITR